jgi:hypothetical protein
LEQSIVEEAYRSGRLGPVVLARRCLLNKSLDLCIGQRLRMAKAMKSDQSPIPFHKAGDG